MATFQFNSWHLELATKGSDQLCSLLFPVVFHVSNYTNLDFSCSLCQTQQTVVIGVRNWMYLSCCVSHFEFVCSKSCVSVQFVGSVSFACQILLGLSVMLCSQVLSVLLNQQHFTTPISETAFTSCYN